MNRTAILGLLLAIVLPLTGYFIVKSYSDNNVHMPSRYFYDSVAVIEKNGRTRTDTLWHSVKHMTFTNQLSLRFEYAKRRQLSLSLIDYQLAENRSTEVTFGFNWRQKGMPLIKKIPFLKGKLDNDVTFKMDFSLRDDATANSKLDQGTSFGTAGQKVIRIAPSIDYIVNNRVSMKLFFEQTRNIPKISNAFPITNTSAGVQVRVSLAQ